MELQNEIDIARSLMCNTSSSSHVNEKLLITAIVV